ncbi:MAG TPA: HAMP domain-containing sensor histidine kinase [Aeromicrobium sp.]|nr:HAMP domain-containing sensor histidine kinase [Aeromicrobium sp.]
MRLADQLDIITVAATAAIAVGVVGFAASWLLRTRSLRWHLAILAVVAVAAPYVGLIAITQRMFISAHDLTVATYVGSVAALVSLLVALGLGSAIGRWSSAVRSNVLRLGSGADLVEPNRIPTEFRELTDALHQAEQELAASRERERLLDQSRRDLISWVSHDLRTPLAGLLAMTEALEDGMAPDPQRYHRQIRRDAGRMATMVDDLFELSTLHSGVMVPHLVPVDLRDLVSETIATADPVARARGVSLGGEIPDGVRINADPAALGRAISNLIMNGIRHTPSDGSVQIEATTWADGVELCVTDGCAGIPDDELERVFEMGWRGTAARTPHDDHGAGLGLAIVRGIVEAHRGEVSVENLEPGPGCRFRILLPA